MQRMRKLGWSSVGLLIVAGALAVLSCRLGTPEHDGSGEAVLRVASPTVPVPDVNHPVAEGGNVRIRFHSIPAHAVPPCASCHVEPGVNSVQVDPTRCGACHEDRSVLFDGQ
jgi:hypothetical protein